MFQASSVEQICKHKVAFPRVTSDTPHPCFQFQKVVWAAAHTAKGVFFTTKGRDQKIKWFIMFFTWRAWIHMQIIFLFLMVHPVFQMWVCGLCSFASHGLVSFSFSPIPELSLSITHFGHWRWIACLFTQASGRQEDLLQAHSAQNN